MKTRLHGLLILTALILPSPSCIDEAGDSSWRNPPRYGHGGTETNQSGRPGESNPRNNRSNRFGYSGDDTRPSPAENGTSAPRDRDRDRNDGRKPEIATNDDKPAVEKPKGPPAVNEMPFAKGVPGKPLSVKLPGYESLGEISIEQLDGGGQPTGKPQPPGTPVSIPDPSNPGKEIYFRVP